MKRAVLLAGLVAVVACQRTEATPDHTSLLVVVSSDLPEALYTGVRVSATARGHTHVWPDPSQAGPQRPPFSVALVPEGSDPGPIDVIGELVTDGGDVVMQEKANDLHFVAGAQLVLTLALDTACLNRICPDDNTTCHRGVCRAADKPAPDQLVAISTDGDTVPPPAPDDTADAGVSDTPVHEVGDDDGDDHGGDNAPVIDGGDDTAGADAAADAPSDAGAREHPMAGGACSDDPGCPGELFCVGGRCAPPPAPETLADTFDLDCATPYTPLCSPPRDQPFTATRTVAVSIDYRASPSLTMPITVQAWLDADSAHAAASRMIQPGDATGPLELGVAGRGPHTIHLTATGARALSEWKGAVQIVTTWAR